VNPIILFLISGFVSMATALSAGALNKLPKDQKEGFLSTSNGALLVVMAGNLAALTLVGAMAYGFANLHWAIPLSCIFISFPGAHVLVTQKLLGNKWSLLLMLPLTLVSAVLLYMYW